MGKLHAEWAKTKPGGHTLTWDGHGQGQITCSTCTKKWPYSFGTWKKQIQVQCAGSPVDEENRRLKLQDQLSQFDTQHSLFLDTSTDYVSCRRCQGYKHPKEWKAFARSACVAPVAATSSGGARRKAELREQYMKKRGRSAPSAPD